MRARIGRKSAHLRPSIALGALTALAVVALFLIPTSTASAAIKVLVSSEVAHPQAVADSWGTYNTTDRSDVLQVAVSPDGSYVAAGTSDRQVLVFASGTGGALTPVATLDLPSGSNATTLAISDTTSTTAAPILVIGYGGFSASSTLETGVQAWNITGSSMFTPPARPIWQLFPSEISLPSGATPWFRQASISEDGSTILVMTAFTFQGLQGTNLSYFETSSSEFHYKFGQDYSDYYPIDIALDADGGRGIAAVRISGATPALILLTSNGFQSNDWIPGSAGGELLEGTISGNGLFMFQGTTSGFDVGDPITGSTSQIVPASLISSPTEISASYNGSQALVTAGDYAYYFNATSNGWATPVWTVQYSGPLENATLAAADPNYFVISTLQSVSWFYLYPGMPTSPSSAYRTISTVGQLNMVAFSASGSTLAAGSGYTTSPGEEFTLATDAGIPTPTGATVAVRQVSASPGQSTASLQVSWTYPTNVPMNEITGIFVSLTVYPAGSAGNNPPTAAPSVGRSSTTVGGLSFNTNYSVEVTFQAFGGATAETTAPQYMTTASPPAVQDPFLDFEVLAVVLLVVGILLLFLFRSGEKPASSASAGGKPKGKRSKDRNLDPNGTGGR